jgi:hypothetical protein
VAPPLVGDHHGDVVQGVAQEVGQVVERLAHELIEVLRITRIAL